MARPFCEYLVPPCAPPICEYASQTTLTPGPSRPDAWCNRHPGSARLRRDALALWLHDRAGEGPAPPPYRTATRADDRRPFSCWCSGAWASTLPQANLPGPEHDRECPMYRPSPSPAPEEESLVAEVARLRADNERLHEALVRLDAALRGIARQLGDQASLLRERGAR